MKHFLLVPISIVLLSALVWADDAAAPSPAQLARQFQRNRGLVQALVHGGLRLAGENDPLKRADYCTGLAECLVDEMRQAADDRETARVAELGQHLHALLEHGVAANLSTARDAIPPGSMEEKGLQDLQERTARVLRPLEERLQRNGDPEGRDDLLRARKAVSEGRTVVEKALKDKAKSQ